MLSDIHLYILFTGVLSLAVGMFSTLLVEREKQRAANVKGLTLKSMYQVTLLCRLCIYIFSLRIEVYNFLSCNLQHLNPFLAPNLLA